MEKNQEIWRFLENQTQLKPSVLFQNNKENSAISSFVSSMVKLALDLPCSGILELPLETVKYPFAIL